MTSITSYEHRPSKGVARHIFVDLLRRLAPIAPLAGYHYVGFGALEFVDFDLMHRHLGITQMTSIESNDDAIQRCEWNRPFNGITVLSGRASSVLATVDWSNLSIVWLDYTGGLTSEVIGDVETLSRLLIPGSVLAVTLNAHPVKIGTRREALERAIGAERVPIGVNDSTLGDWGTARAQRAVLMAAMDSVFRARQDGARWRQLLNITYQDRAKMQMIAGVITSPGTDRAFDQCRFEDLEEMRTGDEPLHIYVPLLTNRERTWVNRRLPLASDDEPLELPGVPAGDLDAYAHVYRRLEAAGGTTPSKP